MNCQSCGCSPCQCAGGGSPAVLANTQLINPLLTGATLDGGTLNGPAINAPAIVGGTIDCTARGCTAGTGVCNDGIATNAFVCNSIANAISSSNAAFCGAVADCIAGDPTVLCPTVGACINTTPGIINNTSAFGFNARATTALYGVTRFATSLELQNGSCLLAIDPCTLIANWNTPALGTPFWNAFVNGVNTVLGGAGLCAAVAACGFAPLASPTFTGIPAGPTAAAGTNTTQLATTAFVNTAISNAISVSNPAFCAAVVGCGGGGGGGGTVIGMACGPAGRARANNPDGSGIDFWAAEFLQGCTLSGSGPSFTVNFSTPQSSANYTVALSWSFTVANFTGGIWGIRDQSQTVNGFIVDFLNFTSGGVPTPPFSTFVEWQVIPECSAAAPVGSGNFASFTVPVTHGGGPGNGTAAGPAVANYGCVVSGVGPNYNVTFTAAQPDLNYIANASMRATSGPFTDIFTGVNSITSTGATHNVGLEALGGVGAVTVNGIVGLGIASPEIGGGVPYTGFVTVVFSR